MSAKHCDNFINDPLAPPCLRAFLEFNRRPAINKVGESPRLFATLQCKIIGLTLEEQRQHPVPPAHDLLEVGQRVRIVMASRLGDVGITPDLEAEHGYVARVHVSDLCDFSEKIDAPDCEERCAPCPICKTKDCISREIKGDARFLRCACGHIGPKATTDEGATARWNELAKGIAQREAGAATVTDRFPDSGTPQVDVKDWAKRMTQERVEAGRLLATRTDAVVKTEDVA